MPRQARIQLAGIPLHVVQRGNNRGACFFAERDQLFYLQQLEALARRFECVVHAYVLMTNHTHLLVTPAAAGSASLLMKYLGQLHVQYVNRTHGRTGTLWEGRFKSSLVQSERYFLRCQRYIELNPVRAGIVAHPRDYRWSSYRVNAELLSSTLVQPHSIYAELGPTREASAAAYRQLCESSLTEYELNEIRSAASGGFALGNRGFKDKISGLLGRRVERMRQLRGQTPKRFA